MERFAFAGRRAARARCAAGAIVLAAICCGLATPPAARAGEATDGVWTRLGPPALSDLSEATFFDPAERRLLSLDRDESGYVLWSYDLDGNLGWQATTGIAQGGLPTFGAHFVLDPDGRRILAFGVSDDFFPFPRPAFAIRAWALDLAAPARWDSLAVLGMRPPERYDPTLALDREGHRIFLAGGRPPEFDGAYGDLWELSLEGTPTWSATAVAGPGLPGFAGGELLFDPGAQRLILSGAADSLDGTRRLRAHVLELDGDRAWHEVAAAETAYSVQEGYPHVLDPKTGLVRVLRGWYSEIPDSSYFWVLDPAGAGSWRQESFSGTERVLAGDSHDLFFDEASDRIVLLGGYGSSLRQTEEEGRRRADVWMVPTGPAGTWVREFSSLRGRTDSWNAPLVHDPVRRNIRSLQGARSGSTFGVPLARRGIFEHHRGTTPAPFDRFDFASVFDPDGNRGIVFGGYLFGALELGDLWEVSYSFTPARWRRLVPDGPAPAARFGASAVYDPVRRRMLMFGGFAGLPLDDLWELDLTRADPTWRLLAPPGSGPRARFWHSAVYDSRRDGMIVHGGATGSPSNFGGLRDTWMLSFADGDLWVPLDPGSPVEGYRFAHGAVYDPVDDRMIVLHGRDVAGPRLDGAALELSSGTGWIPFVPGGSGPPVSYHPSMFYDAPEDRIVVFSGSRSLDGGRLERLHELRFDRDPNAGPPPLLDGPALQLLAVGPNPSSGDVLVSFQVPRQTDVRLRLYDVRGRLVRDFGDRTFLPGPHVVRWDGRGDDGGRLRDGVYFARLEAAGERVTGKLVRMN